MSAAPSSIPASSPIVFADEASPHLTVHRSRLPCGLDVLIHPDNSVPQVCVSVWYRVAGLISREQKTFAVGIIEAEIRSAPHEVWLEAATWPQPPRIGCAPRGSRA